MDRTTLKRAQDNSIGEEGEDDESPEGHPSEAIVTMTEANHERESVAANGD
jgi:hypothetical protein